MYEPHRYLHLLCSSYKHLILAYSRQSGYPALETHSHASAYTDQGAYRLQATMHASHRVTSFSLGRCRNTASYAEYAPDANILRLAESGGVVVYQQVVSACQ
jgi:hypothetical protein